MDSLALLVRTQPRAALRLPLWLLRGKAALKSEVAARVSLDPRHLPWNTALLRFLQDEHASGRRIYLTTGADLQLAEPIATHLGIFAGVLASNGKTNFTGNNKLDGLRRLFGETGFDYIGNASADLPLLAAAGAAILANPSAGLCQRLRSRKIEIAKQFDDHAPRHRAFLKAIRLHQWAKNLLIFLPLVLAHKLSPLPAAQTLLAFLAFSLCASATYIVNDVLDMEADRHHPRKRLRPFAAGDLSVTAGAALSAALLTGALAIAAFLLPLPFLGWLLLYLVTTLSYSLCVKKIALADVILLSGLYTLRLLAGAAATRVPISPWLAAFALFLFLSLAMVKRFSELQNTRARGQKPANGRGYLLADIEQLRSFGTSSAYASVVVFSFYIGAHNVTALYPHAAWLWLITPLMILWLSRIWLLASRGELDEDPLVFALTDRMSLLIGVGVALIAALAAL
jgi:4-hydroxybenzoate polyprenyltransferase/phosphoserine phosphatase